MRGFYRGAGYVLPTVGSHATDPFAAQATRPGPGPMPPASSLPPSSIPPKARPAAEPDVFMKAEKEQWMAHVLKKYSGRGSTPPASGISPSSILLRTEVTVPHVRPPLLDDFGVTVCFRDHGRKFTLAGKEYLRPEPTSTTRIESQGLTATASIIPAAVIVALILIIAIRAGAI